MADLRIASPHDKHKIDELYAAEILRSWAFQQLEGVCNRSMSGLLATVALRSR